MDDTEKAQRCIAEVEGTTSSPRVVGTGEGISTVPNPKRRTMHGEPAQVNL